ncbi:MAG: hypothetical protein JJU02_03880 [Cryomorphaceae bacterium]|nr:hypothetical protein [Cryomorphaceae bacterium]
MSNTSFSKIMLFIALAVIQLHAIVPHDHEPNCTLENGQDIISTENCVHLFWHPDLGEDHLDQFNISASNVFIPVVFADFNIETIEVKYLGCKHLVPQNLNLPPPPSQVFCGLRAPPIFA